MRKPLLLALLAALALAKPLLWPLLENTGDLAALLAERNELSRRVEESGKANAKLRRDFLALRGRDPFTMERLARETGRIRPVEFDYALLADTLAGKRALPSCPKTPPRPE